MTQKLDFDLVLPGDLHGSVKPAVARPTVAVRRKAIITGLIRETRIRRGCIVRRLGQVDERFAVESIDSVQRISVRELPSGYYHNYPFSTVEKGRPVLLWEVVYVPQDGFAPPPVSLNRSQDESVASHTRRVRELLPYLSERLASVDRYSNVHGEFWRRTAVERLVAELD